MHCVFIYNFCLSYRYHVKVHLCALRQYLLLGQGDFVNYLMKLVEYLEFIFSS